MNVRLRLILTALSDPREYQRNVGPSWIAVFLAFLVAVGLPIGLGYLLWANWTPLLIINSFNPVFISVFQSIPLILMFGRFSLDMGQSPYAYSAGQLTLAYALRSALAAGSEAVAPVLATPPQDAELRALAEASQETAPLVVAAPQPLSISCGSVIGMYLLSTLLLLLAGGGVALVTVSFNAPIQQVANSTVGAIALAVVGGGMPLLALLALIQGIRLERQRLRQRGGITVEMDSLGLRFHQPVWERQPRQIAWADMRALASFTYKDWYTRTHTIYVLVSDEQILLWEEPPTERYASEPVQQRISALQRSAWALAATITRRTGLPVRDLSLTVATLRGKDDTTTQSGFLRDAYDLALKEGDVAVATALWRWQSLGVGPLPRALRKLIAAPVAPTTAEADEPAVPARLAKRGEQFTAAHKAYLAKQKSLLELARALIPYAPAEAASRLPVSVRRYLGLERVRRQLSRQLMWLSLIAIVALLFSIGAYWVSEQVMTSRLSAIGQQTITQPPTYFASLTSPLSEWPVQSATQNDPSAAAFANGGYQLSSTNVYLPAMFSIPRNDRGDFAIAVTIRIHGVQQSADKLTSGGGLLLDVSGDWSAYTQFGISADGGWTLARLDNNRSQTDPWDILDGGTSAAIHTADGAANRLLIVRHGPLYLLYINGALVTRFYADSRAHHLPAGGDVGVYIDDGSVTARFNDFAIYPIPPQLAALAVDPSLSWLLTN